MARGELGPWEPMRPDEAAAVFDTLKVSWCSAGGWAIDVILGDQSRDHGDLDVLVLRRDRPGSALPQRMGRSCGRPARKPPAMAGG